MIVRTSSNVTFVPKHSRIIMVYNFTYQVFMKKLGTYVKYVERTSLTNLLCLDIEKVFIWKRERNYALKMNVERNTLPSVN